jgi:TonB family protein
MRMGVALVVLALALPSIAGATEMPRWLSIGATHDAKDVGLFYRALTAYESRPAGRESFDAQGAKDFSMRSVEPGIGGAWAFFGVDGAPAPQSAIRLRLATHAPYRVSAELYCDGANCDALRVFLSDLSAPWVQGESALVESWHSAISEEACDPLKPPSRPKFVYPREELRREIEGTVIASVFHNRCGDVRDVNITTSSGNRNLDRMATKHLLRSRVAPAKANTAGWKQETFEFRLDNPENPPRAIGIDVKAI